MSLPHNHMTLKNLLISSYQIWDLVKSSPSDHVTLINLYISSYGEATGAIFIHINA